MKSLFGFICILMLSSFCLSGCEQAEKDTEIVFTTEFGPDEVFRIDKESCTLPEVNVYMRTSQDQYESVFGNEIWDKDLGGITLENRLKDIILARLAQIKVMKLLSASYDITLTDEELKLISEAAKEYYSQLSKAEIADMQVDEQIINDMYCDYTLAKKVYGEITKDINPEISDDEARTITVKHILIKTYSLDEEGNKVEYTDSQRKDAKRRIDKVMAQLKNGADFDNMAEEYNEDKELIYSFGKGFMPKEFEDAAFNLDNDQISGVVETEYGYHIIKCVSTFDKNQTDENKGKIVQQRKNEAFNQVYSEFVKSVYSNLNEELWNSIKFDNNPEVTTTNFFDIYDEKSINSL